MKFEKKPDRENELMHLGEEWETPFVSYHPNPGGDPISQLCDIIMSSAVGPETEIREGPQTSLCITTAEGNDDHWVLYGDWRAQYEAAAAEGGVLACAELFERIKAESPGATLPDAWLALGSAVEAAKEGQA